VSHTLGSTEAKCDAVKAVGYQTAEVVAALEELVQQKEF